jgi:hypothetical protein
MSETTATSLLHLRFILYLGTQITPDHEESSDIDTRIRAATGYRLPGLSWRRQTSSSTKQSI